MAVPSPYHGTKLTVGQQVAISAYWFATNFLWGALLVIMLPEEIKAIAPSYRVTALGALTGIAAVVALLVPLIVGALSDRCMSTMGRRRPYIIAGVLVNLIGIGLMAWAFATRTPVTGPSDLGYWGIIGKLLSNQTFLLFLSAYMLVQLGNNIASAAYSGVIPDLVPADQRGRASGYMALMSQMGTLVGGVVCGVLIHSSGTSPAAITSTETMRFVALGAVLAAVALITILGIRETPLDCRPQNIRWGEYVKSLWIDPRKYPDFAWVWITRAMVMLGFYAVLPFINYYFTDVIGVPDKDVSLTATALMGVILITSSISGILGGYVSDKIGRKKVVYIANAAIALMSIFFIFCRTVPQTMLVGALFGLGFGAYTSVDWALGTDVLPTKSNAAKEMAVWHIAMTLPQSIAAPLSAALIAAFGMTVSQGHDGPVAHYTIPGYSAVFALCAVCFAAGAYFLKNVRGVK
ncbi:MAG: hypothetical protein QOJ65_2243 [Fimbriimonadaceae bacterium]|nr:hypothetical protein [Fimbriimonadaceae bacterium]